MSENIVKETSKRFGLTYEQLAEQIGYGLDVIKKSGASGKVSDPVKKAIELFIQTEEQKEIIASLSNPSIEELYSKLPEWKKKKYYHLIAAEVAEEEEK